MRGGRNFGRNARTNDSPGARRRGFTLLEIMLALAILSAVSTVTYMTFSVVMSAWKRGLALSDDLQHGDFVIEQLVLGLRSAYLRDAAEGGSADCGFWLENNGSDPYSSDAISWVKLGTALVGSSFPFAENPHRVEFRVEEDARGEPAAAIRAWHLHGLPEDFDPDEIEPLFLSSKVVGFNCRCGAEVAGGEIQWEDEWEMSNSVPPFIELTLFLQPLEEGEPPVEVKRIVTVPMVTQRVW